MIEVLSEYKKKEQTFFLAIKIMDQYFQKTQKILEMSDLHLVGLTSMFLACKLEEIHPINLKNFTEVIAKNKFTR